MGFGTTPSAVLGIHWGSLNISPGDGGDWCTSYTFFTCVLHCTIDLLPLSLAGCSFFLRIQYLLFFVFLLVIITLTFLMLLKHSKSMPMSGTLSLFFPLTLFHVDFPGYLHGSFPQCLQISAKMLITRKRLPDDPIQHIPFHFFALFFFTAHITTL